MTSKRVVTSYYDLLCLKFNLKMTLRSRKGGRLEFENCKLHRPISFKFCSRNSNPQISVKSMMELIFNFYLPFEIAKKSHKTIKYPPSKLLHYFYYTSTSRKLLFLDILHIIYIVRRSRYFQ